MSLVRFKDRKGNVYPYLYILKETGVFYVVKRIGKKVFKKSLDTTDFNIARSMILHALKSFEDETQPKKQTQKIFSDYWQMVLDEKVALGLKESSIKKAQAVYDHALKEYWEFLHPEDCTQEQVINFMTWHKRKRPGRQFVNVFKYLGNTFRIMFEAGALPAGSLPKLFLPKDEVRYLRKKKGRVITDDEIDSILRFGSDDFKLIVSIGRICGMRKMELCSLELSRVNFKDGRYVLVLDEDDTKTGLARNISMPTSLTKAISRRVQKSKALGSSYLFPMATDKNRHIYGQLLDKEWVEAKKSAKIDGRMRFHDIRHTAATNMVKKKINPVVAVTILGMSLSTFQKVYLHLSSDDLISSIEQMSVGVAVPL